MWAIRYSPPAYVRRVRVVGKKTRAKPKNPLRDPPFPSKKKTCQKSQYKTDVLESGDTDRNEPNVLVAYPYRAS